MAQRDYQDWSLAELIAYRQRLAQTVNRQMRRVAEAGILKKPGAYTKYAFPYLRQFGRDRFSTAKLAVAGRTERQQRLAEIKEISAMERLKSAKTYSIAGYRASKRAALEGLARAAGIDINSPEGRKFIDETAESIAGSEQWGWLKRTVGSEALLEVSRQIAKGNATRNEILNRISAMQAKDVAGRTYTDVSGRPHTLQPDTWTETVNRVDPSTGEITSVSVTRQRSIYTDVPLEIVYDELGFSSYQNVFGEDYDDEL